MTSVGLSAVVAVLFFLMNANDGALVETYGHHVSSTSQCLKECHSNLFDLRCTICRLQRLEIPTSYDTIFAPPSARSLHEVVIRPADFISYKRIAPMKDDNDLTETLRRLLSRVSYKYLYM